LGLKPFRCNDIISKGILCYGTATGTTRPAQLPIRSITNQNSGVAGTIVNSLVANLK